MDLERPGGGGKEKRGTRDQERRKKEKRLHEDLGGEKTGSPGTGFVMLNRLSQPMFSLSPPPFPLPLCG